MAQAQDARHGRVAQRHRAVGRGQRGAGEVLHEQGAVLRLALDQGPLRGDPQPQLVSGCRQRRQENQASDSASAPKVSGSSSIW